MNKLNPGQNYAFALQLTDPTDSTVYFPQTVIKDAITRGTVYSKTLNLVDRGGQLYTENWDVPQDPTGTGFQLYAVTTVYTDSARTTKSSNYAITIEHILAQQNWQIGLGGRGWGGASFDYKKLRDIVSEVVDEKLSHLPPLSFPPQEKLTPVVARLIRRVDAVGSGLDTLRRSIPNPVKLADLEPLRAQIVVLHRLVESLPRFKETDLEPVSKLVKTEILRIQEIIGELPKFEPVDLSPVLKSLEEIPKLLVKKEQKKDPRFKRFLFLSGADPEGPQESKAPIENRTARLKLLSNL